MYLISFDRSIYLSFNLKNPLVHNDFTSWCQINRVLDIVDFHRLHFFLHCFFPFFCCKGWKNLFHCFRLTFILWYNHKSLTLIVRYPFTIASMCLRFFLSQFIDKWITLTWLRIPWPLLISLFNGFIFIWIFYFIELKILINITSAWKFTSQEYGISWFKFSHASICLFSKE